MNAELIAIGSELLLGETVDTNSAYLARQAACVEDARDVVRHPIVQRIVQAYEKFENQSDG